MAKKKQLTQAELEQLYARLKPFLIVEELIREIETMDNNQELVLRKGKDGWEYGVREIKK